MPSINVREFRPEDKDAVIDVILPIQQAEFAIPITVEAQPDLLSVKDFYLDSGGTFLVAELDGRIIGTVALLQIGQGMAALRKMFVKKEFRGAAFGVANQLLDALLAWATCHGIHHIYLGTTDKFLAAHRFYEKNGFSRIACEALPQSFPIMKVDSVFYQRAL